MRIGVPFGRKTDLADVSIRDDEYRLIKRGHENDPSLSFLELEDRHGLIAKVGYNYFPHSQLGFFAGAQVDQVMRKKGFFKTMMFLTTQYLERQGLSRIFLKTSIIRKPELALVLEKMGYVPVTRNCCIQLLGKSDSGVPLISPKGSSEALYQGRQFDPTGKIAFYEFAGKETALPGNHRSDAPIIFLHTNYTLQNRKLFDIFCRDGGKDVDVNFY